MTLEVFSTKKAKQSGSGEGQRSSMDYPYLWWTVYSPIISSETRLLINPQNSGSCLLRGTMLAGWMRSMTVWQVEVAIMEVRKVEED
jgi:hypothetical protein